MKSILSGLAVLVLSAAMSFAGDAKVTNCCPNGTCCKKDAACCKKAVAKKGDCCPNGTCCKKGACCKKTQPA
ncbi:MAG: hypothetical protein ACLQBJ_01405 [Bryobacteraceae bacterium]